MTIIRNVLALLTAAFICSCSGESCSSDGQAADTTADGVPANFEISDCYAYQAAKDSAFLRIDILEDDMAVGKLSYALFEKDRNEGDFVGTIQGDKIFAHYTFNAEGKSVREVAFRKAGDGWVEGFGEVKDSAGVMIFKNRAKVDFQKGLHFAPVKCKPAP